jgi:uncharacterized phiE125 gp8 family phage protein
MSARLITAPALEPVTLAEAKLHLRVDGTDEDTLITPLIVAARQYAEHLTERALITQAWELVVDAFPSAEIRLPRPPLISITSVKYDDTAGVERTLSPTTYSPDVYSEPGWLLPAHGYDWPDTWDAANAVRVRYSAGYGAAASAVPEGIKSWILLRVGSLYRQREELVDGRLITPSYIDRLLDPYRVYG